MIGSLWDIFLLVIGFGTLLCIPVTILAAIGLFVTIAVQSITPSHPNSLVVPIVSQADSEDDPANQAAANRWESLDPTVLPEWLRDDPQQNSLTNNAQISNQTKTYISSEKPTLFHSSLRWLSIIFIYTIAYGVSMVVFQLTAQSFQPPVQFAITILIFNAFTIIGLTTIYAYIKNPFTKFQATGWLISVIASISLGTIFGIYVWSQEGNCIDSACIYNSQVSGLAVATGVFFAIFYLVEWIAVWGEKYRTGRWLIGIFIGLVTTIFTGLFLLLITQVEWISLAPPIGWTICVFIATSNVSGDGFYERRLLGVFPTTIVGAVVILALSLIVAQPRCLCGQEISELAWRWFAAGGLIGSLSGITWLYLWQVAPIDERTVFMVSKQPKAR
jgi:hypothetical protein